MQLAWYSTKTMFCTIPLYRVSKRRYVGAKLHEMGAVHTRVGGRFEVVFVSLKRRGGSEAAGGALVRGSIDVVRRTKNSSSQISA